MCPSRWGILALNAQGLDAIATPAAPSRSAETGRALRSGLEFVGIAAAYLAIAESSLWIPWINPFNAPAWPPTGFALALVVLRGRHVWPAVVIGCFGASMLAGHAYWPSALISVGVVAAALGGDLLLRLWAKDAARDALATPVQVARFGAVCAIASVMMSIILAFASAFPFGTNAFAGSAAAWMNWGLVDAGGSILIAPAMVLWPRTDASKLRYLETALLSVIAGAIAIVESNDVIGQRGWRAIDPALPIRLTPVRWKS